MYGSTKILIAAGLLTGLAAAPAQAQLLGSSPVRVQVGNGPALIGSNSPTGAVGLSVLSNQVGTDDGTSIRLLGDDKTAGIYTRLIKSNGSNGTRLLYLRTPLEQATAPITK
ncbi:MAG: hypothetical protein AABZ73_05385 [Pseudomonadota bacterium]|uniref:hypothetical protein n=1 Tax=Sphingobium sp. TaxID=1912891 RepID=UPI002E24387D